MKQMSDNPFMSLLKRMVYNYKSSNNHLSMFYLVVTINLYYQMAKKLLSCWMKRELFGEFSEVCVLSKRGVMQMDLTMNESAREELLEAIEGLSVDDYNGERGGANHWTVKQTVEHISIMEKAVADMVLDAIGSSNGPTKKSAAKDDDSAI